VDVLPREAEIGGTGGSDVPKPNVTPSPMAGDLSPLLRSVVFIDEAALRAI